MIKATIFFILIIIATNIHFPYFAAVQPVLKTVQSHCPSTSYSLFCQKLPTVRHAFRITAFCTGIYRAGVDTKQFQSAVQFVWYNTVCENHKMVLYRLLSVVVVLYAEQKISAPPRCG
jgi:hypothetical protein